jgi:UDP-3-O-[3-hydroxymyristoyl] glucosamine N-acyltransferase
MMKLTLSEIAALAGGEVDGDGSVEIRGVASPESATAGEITFAEDDRTLEVVLAGNAGAVIVRANAEVETDRPLVRVKHPRIAFVAAANALHPEPRPEPGVHPTAIVADGAEIGEDASIGPYAVIEADVVLGPRVVVGAGCVLCAGSRVGADSRLWPRVVLYPGVAIGERAIVHAGVVLGADGFGYVDVPEGKRKFPQLGRLVIEDDVEIGANSTIDRAALDATVVHSGAKIDNLVQIGHNCEIGRHAAICALSGLAGSVKIGERAILGGKAGIGDHAVVGDRVILGGNTGIPSNREIPPDGAWFGYVARPYREELKLMTEVGRLPRLKERVRELERRLDALEGAEE